jgi:transcriptional regulator with XRE-family HTH domain
MSLEETGRRIMNKRRDLRLTQKELAAQCGFKYQVLSRVERGHQDVFAQRLARIAAVLHVSADYLLGLSEKEACDVHT